MFELIQARSTHKRIELEHKSKLDKFRARTRQSSARLAPLDVSNLKDPILCRSFSHLDNNTSVIHCITIENSSGDEEERKKYNKIVDLLSPIMNKCFCKSKRKKIITACTPSKSIQTSSLIQLLTQKD